MTKDSSNPNLALTATNRFTMPDGELGVALTLSDQTRRIVAHNSETGGWGEEAIDSDWEMRYYDRERQGVVLNLDYHVDGDNYIYPFQRVDTESRPRVEVRTISSFQLGGILSSMTK